MKYCKNCGLEVLQLCFCNKKGYLKDFSVILNSKSLVTAIDFYIKNYKDILTSLKHVKERHNLVNPPANFFLIDSYKKWVK